ncbi:hypothetical protein EX30DRAFT_129061 [Ascodesmis nigricans]|uniref:Uncharacterized protein n=1 Tax=Ascodesmis nigricans TaxID=341454 RepID=A0A4S2MP05_9PEZI|nr:hypothetical protein EX30DRAFT_129061 [Ascodesmis nigricans]
MAHVHQTPATSSRQQPSPLNSRFTTASLLPAIDSLEDSGVLPVASALPSASVRAIGPHSTPIPIPLHDKPASGLRTNTFSSPPGSYIMSSAARNPIRLVGAKSRSSSSSTATTIEDKMNQLVVYTENDAVSGYGPGALIPIQQPKSFLSSTLEEENLELTEQEREDLSHHKITKAMATKMFGRSRSSSSKIPLLKETKKPFALSEEDEETETYANINLNPTVEDQTDSEDDRPKTIKAAVVKKFIAKSQTIAGLVETLRSAHSNGSENAIADDDDCTLHDPAAMFQKRSHQIRFAKAPLLGEDESERLVPEVIVDPEVAESMSQADIDALLDSMLPMHAAEFMADQERMYQHQYRNTENKHEKALVPPSKNYVGCMHKRPKPMTLQERGIRMYNGESPAREEEDNHCPECEKEFAQKKAQRAQEEDEYKRLEVTELWEIIAPKPNTHRQTRAENFLKTEDELLAETLVTEELYQPPIRIPSGPTLGVVTNHPPQFDGASTGTIYVPPFGCIFTVWIPLSSNGASISPHGRPLVHDDTEFGKFTVVASYHHGPRIAVIDMLDLTVCPLGFSTEQLVDLIYLQKSGCLPPYIVWPAPVTSRREIAVTQQWSLCRPALNGQDVLHVSDTDVMVQRVVGAVYRLATTASMPFQQRQNYLAALAYDCEDNVNVTLRIATRDWRQDRLAAEVPADFRANSQFDWHLPTSQQLSFGHSRTSHPVSCDVTPVEA